MSGLQGVKVGDPIWIRSRNWKDERRFVKSAGPKWVHTAHGPFARDSGLAKDGFGFAMTEAQYTADRALVKLRERIAQVERRLENWRRVQLSDEQVAQRTAVVEQIEKLLEDG